MSYSRRYPQRIRGEVMCEPCGCQMDKYAPTQYKEIQQEQLQKQVTDLTAEVVRLRDLANNLYSGNLRDMPGNDSYNKGYFDGAKMSGDNILKIINHKEG